MKKLYTKGKIHPSPPPISDHLALLPATILTLAVALSPQDREVLAYLISCSGNSNNSSGHHKSNSVNGRGGSGGDQTAQFNCNCFRCYMSYWVRWDTSPNREVIHEIIDAYEDGHYIGTLDQKNYNVKSKKERRKRNSNSKGNSGNEKKENEMKENITNSGEMSFNGEIEERGEELYGEVEKGSVRKIVSFLGERIWGVWGI